MTHEASPPFLESLFDATGQGASDIHFLSDQIATMRLHGELNPINHDPIHALSLEQFLESVCGQDLWGQFQEKRNLDLAVECNDPRTGPTPGCSQRFRLNLFYSGDRVGSCFRVIPSVIPDFAWANFPTSIASKLIGLRNGLVIFSGVTGSGKTTSMAMMIQEILRNEAQRVITIEDPIEYILPSEGGSLISQREVGRDVDSFSEGLKYSMRQDPNIILVGEIRDEATARMALSAAETGHLVLTTLHTRDAKGAITRLVDLFPNNNHSESCSLLAIALRAVVCQHLLPSIFEGEKRELAVEVMYNTHPVAAAIRSGRFDSLDNAILSGRKEGMIALDESVRRLLQEERILESVAEHYVSDPQLLRR